MTQQPPLIGCTTYRKKTASYHQTKNGNQPIYVDGLMRTYTNAILAAGGLPVLIPLTYSDDQVAALFARLDGVLLPGGGDIDPAEYGGEANGQIYGVDSNRDRIELWLAREAVKTNKPVLGICRGVQVLNVALGGTLWEDVLECMPHAHKHAYFHGYERNLLSHEVEIEEKSCLSYVMGHSGGKLVNSIHHQGIRRLAEPFSAVARAADGLIEGIEIPGHSFAVGVQWHPEELVSQDPQMRGLFSGLIRTAADNSRSSG